MSSHADKLTGGNSRRLALSRSATDTRPISPDVACCAYFAGARVILNKQFGLILFASILDDAPSINADQYGPQFAHRC
jgi:hypothetical protein